MNRVNEMIEQSVSGEYPRTPIDNTIEAPRRAVKPGNINPHLVCLLQPRSAEAESYYRLRHVLESLHDQKGGLVVAVTSPGEGDGKTLTAINLAGALAQDVDARVLLVDLDLRQTGTSVHDYLDQKQQAGPGVVGWIGKPELNSAQVIHPMPGFNLHLMSAGGWAESPYELLKSERLDELLAQARQSYDFVILDTPQVLRLPDSELISRLVDGFLIVVRADYTPQKLLEETLNLMSQEKVLGLIFNADADPR
jgi:Mrp family chromosome partitioning ATPase